MGEVWKILSKPIPINNPTIIVITKSVAIFNNSNNYLIIIRFVIFFLPTVIVIKYVPCSTLLKSTT